MVISPTLAISSIKVRIVITLFIRVFLFSFFYSKGTTNEEGKEIVKIMGKTLSLEHHSTSVRRSPGPFMIKILKCLALLSILSLVLSVYSEFNSIKITVSLWIKKTSTKISLKFLYDKYFLVFLTVALVVTWSIMEFSYYYMDKDPKSNAFFRLLTVFLLKMLILTCSKRLFLIFLGWEGVGFLSFLLISWWVTRKDARRAALEAVIYNRIGDIGLITFMALSVYSLNSWKLKEIILDVSGKNLVAPFMIFGLILAAAGKSAQFGLHPWLPAAMEGPTPVSALLHSSTMVVAGVFLLVRTEPLFSRSPNAQTVVLLLGGVTALFAASTAVAQHDIKKIIAYSTTRQLGLMVTAIGIGQPLLALFHICTHAFFKAMLFMCSGRIIHRLKDEQDLRKMGGIRKLLPVTSACLILGSLALMGTPFLAGFYSKDLILEATGASLLKALGLSLSMVATLLTAVYRLRVVVFCFLSNPKISSLSPIGEEKKNLKGALLRLSLGTLISGWFFSKFIFVAPGITLPEKVKSLPLVITVIGTTLAIVIIRQLITEKVSASTHRALSLQWFFVDLSHSVVLTLSFLSSLFLSSRRMDRGWRESVGPQGAGKLFLEVSKRKQASQSGLIKRYVSSSIILVASIASIIAFFAS